MSYRYAYYILFAHLACSQSAETPVPQESTYSIGITGDAADVTVATTAGYVLMGGSTDVDDAIQWMIGKASGGDFLILRASGSTGYNDYVYGLGNLNSVETLLIDSREKALSKKVGERIRQAEAVFIAGGDQYRYISYWNDSEVSSALHYLIHEKGVPIGGTSAGCAILSDYVFDAANGSVTSAEALQNPYNPLVSVTQGFIKIPELVNIIADQHFSQRTREGRLVTFMARITKDKGIPLRGIGVDEQTALCISADGSSVVFGNNTVYFLYPKETPEQCEPNNVLHWKKDDQAVSVFAFTGSVSGTPALNVKLLSPSDPHTYWHVEEGVLVKH
jgi:cyanophycinase